MKICVVVYTHTRIQTIKCKEFYKINTLKENKNHQNSPKYNCRDQLSTLKRVRITETILVGIYAINGIYRLCPLMSMNIGILVIAGRETSLSR